MMLGSQSDYKYKRFGYQLTHGQLLVSLAIRVNTICTICALRHIGCRFWMLQVCTQLFDMPCYFMPSCIVLSYDKTLQLAIQFC